LSTAACLTSDHVSLKAMLAYFPDARCESAVAG
jgi:hypothetical protein